MKFLRRLLALLLSCSLLLLLVPVALADPGAIPVASITGVPASLTMIVNDVCQLTPTVVPDTADNQRLIFSSSNMNVAEVDQQGYVYAYAPGRATIVIRAANGHGARVVIPLTVRAKSAATPPPATPSPTPTVEPTPAAPMLQDVYVSRKSLQLELNEQLDILGVLTVHTVPANLAMQTRFKWRVGDEHILSISGTTVQALAAGETYLEILALDGSGASDRVQVTVVG